MDLLVQLRGSGTGQVGVAVGAVELVEVARAEGVRGTVAGQEEVEVVIAEDLGEVRLVGLLDVDADASSATGPT
ncbi:hypothetical protein ABZ619_12930 [Streptomyces sp. NPDC007851]|uniref:hypothetical protein n=1 Tax=Streptomyces sp. NPDC007851 TaxID=3155008 RepID=UPI00340E7251